MPGFVDTVIESLKQTLNWPLLLYFFAVQLIEGVVIGVILVFFVLLGLLSLFGSLDFSSIQGIAQQFSNPALLLNLVGIIALLVVAFFLVVMYVSALFAGWRLNLFNNFLKSKRLDLGRAFAQAKPRAFTYFKIDLLVTVIILLVLFVPFFLAFLPILAYLPGSPPSTVVGQFLAGILAAFLWLLLGLIALFFVSPVMFLFAPVAFFERQGAIDSIRRSIALVKTNYWGNLAFILVYFVIVFFINLIVNAILRILSIPLLVPLVMAGESGAGPAVAGMLGFMALFGVLSVIILVPYVIWVVAFQIACLRNLYFLDFSLFRGPGGKARPKRRTK